jgi:molybdopterin synthase catalytic subunit
VNAGRAVEGIDYRAYEPMAARELAGIAAEAERRWPGVRVAVAHRVGYLRLGEASVAIASSHAHRAPAFEACRWVLEAVKRRVPVWKREHYADGGRDWVDARAGASTAGAPAPDVRDEPGLDPAPAGY